MTRELAVDISNCLMCKGLLCSVVELCVLAILPCYYPQSHILAIAKYGLSKLFIPSTRMRLFACVFAMSWNKKWMRYCKPILAHKLEHKKRSAAKRPCKVTEGLVPG